MSSYEGLIRRIQEKVNKGSLVRMNEISQLIEGFDHYKNMAASWEETAKRNADRVVELENLLKQLVAEETDSPLMTVDEIVAVAEGARLALELKKVVNANDELEDTITRLRKRMEKARRLIEVGINRLECDHDPEDILADEMPRAHDLLLEADDE